MERTWLYAARTSGRNAKEAAIFPVVTSSSQSPPFAALPVRFLEAATLVFVSWAMRWMKVKDLNATLQP